MSRYRVTLYADGVESEHVEDAASSVDAALRIVDACLDKQPHEFAVRAKLDETDSQAIRDAEAFQRACFAAGELASRYVCNLRGGGDGGVLLEDAIEMARDALSKVDP